MVLAKSELLARDAIGQGRSHFRLCSAQGRLATHGEGAAPLRRSLPDHEVVVSIRSLCQEVVRQAEELEVRTGEEPFAGFHLGFARSSRPVLS